MKKYDGLVDVSGITSSGKRVKLTSFIVDSADHGDEVVANILEQIERYMPNGWLRRGGLFIRLAEFCAITVRFNEPGNSSQNDADDQGNMVGDDGLEPPTSSV